MPVASIVRLWTANVMSRSSDPAMIVCVRATVSLSRASGACSVMPLMRQRPRPNASAAAATTISR